MSKKKPLRSRATRTPGEAEKRSPTKPEESGSSHEASEKKAGHEVDPESDSRSWRYAWERAWRDGLEVKW